MKTKIISSLLSMMIIPLIVFILGSLNYNNDYTNARLYYSKVAEVEVRSVVITDIKSVKLPDLKLGAQIDREQIRCLATNIYYEAKSEPFMGQVAVARVVINRIKAGFAGTPCSVVYQKTTNTISPSKETVHCQFSWVCQSKIQPLKDNPQYKVAEDIATQVLRDDAWSENIPDNILFFHSIKINPGWRHHKEFVIGNHVFYSKLLKK